MADEAAARLGKKLGNYVLQEIVGRGGMGVVYRGEHIYIRKRVAVKVMYRQHFGNPEARERFLREAQAASSIQHPNVVSVTDFGEEPDGTVFLVMDHVEGRSLERVLRDEKTIDLFRTISITSQVARALAEAHRRGIVHRDLKPENIMLEHRPERRQIVRRVQDARGMLEVLDHIDHFDFATVVDFGAAKVWNPDAITPTEPGVVLATPLYMAPETAKSGVSDARSDIYAAGVIVYQMLTGTVPFSGESAAEIMMKHVMDPVEPPRRRNPRVEITPEAERLVLRTLAKDPEQRHRSMDELYTDLQRCYGSVRFRRTDEPVPDGLPVASLRRPIPLTREKRPSGPPGAPIPSPIPAPPSAPRAPSPVSSRATPPGATPVARSTPHPQVGPVPAAKLGNANSGSSPIPLTKRKERHRTLPFGATPVPAAPADEAPEPERHPTHPYAPTAGSGETPNPNEP